MHSANSNVITDVLGLKVGNAHDATLCSGVTVVLADQPFIAAVDVRGGGPGSRETDALGLTGTVDEAHAIVLSGGSAFGLAASSGVQNWLAERGRGFAVGTARVPIVPQAVLFDLLNGGNKNWGRCSPYEALGWSACEAASTSCDVGSVGAGYGATTANLRGGLGTASHARSDGIVIGALAAVNPVGSVTIGSSPHFWASPFEQGAEFGRRGQPHPWPDDGLNLTLKQSVSASPGPQNTTLAIVATNARLTKRQMHRLAVMAQTGLARAIYPVHTPLDGDLVFAISTRSVPFDDRPLELATLGAQAANTLARAIARGVYAASPVPNGWTGPPAYRCVFDTKRC